MIAFRPGVYYLGFWFVGGTTTDWFAALWREDGGDQWMLQTRFRYHNSPDPWDDNDRKSQSDFAINGSTKTEAELVEQVNVIASVAGAGLGAKPVFVEVRGDCDRAMFRLAQQPWCHIKMQRKETQ